MMPSLASSSEPAIVGEGGIGLAQSVDLELANTCWRLFLPAFVGGGGWPYRDSDDLYGDLGIFDFVNSWH